MSIRKNSKATRITAYTMDPNDVWIYGHDTEHDSTHPLVDDDMDRVRKLDKAMVANMKHRGCIEPIECAVIGDDVVVVNGRRRVVHLRAANEERKAEGLEPLKIKFVTRSGGENSQDHKLTAISANTFRADHGPVAQARKAAQLIDAGVDRGEVANSMGFSLTTLDNRLQLLELAPKVQKAIEAGQVGAMAGLELRKLEKDEQVAALEKVIAESGGSRKGQAKKAKKAANGASDSPERPTVARLRKLLETEEAAELPVEVLQTIRWVIGEGAPNPIKGLKAAYDATGKKKAPPRVTA